MCHQGHDWRAVVKDRTSGKGCPYCAGRRVGKDNNLAVRYPDLIKEWHPTKNGKLTPHKVMPGSHRKVWWICDQGHEWKANISNRGK